MSGTVRSCIISVPEEIFYSFFHFPFQCILEKYQFGLCTTVWTKVLCLRLSFYLLIRTSLHLRYGFFFRLFDHLTHLELLKIELPKLALSILMENCDHSICPSWSILFLYALTRKARLLKRFIFELNASCYSFKITCNLLRQVIRLKKMLVSSAKITTLFSWSPICIILFFLSTLMKLASTLAAIMYNSMESEQP